MGGGTGDTVVVVTVVLIFDVVIVTLNLWKLPNLLNYASAVRVRMPSIVVGLAVTAMY